MSRVAKLLGEWNMVLSRRFSRRQVLRIGAAASAAAALDVTRWTFSVSAAGAVEAVRSEWTFREGLPSDGDWESPVLTPETGFDAIDLSWDAES
ncbi:MAG TPA: hypothetical protein DCX80_11210, partial [Chloroflexi bacterium]|nr:hypothetical protein [Chloroflexota bacterium]